MKSFSPFFILILLVLCSVQASFAQEKLIQAGSSIQQTPFMGVTGIGPESEVQDWNPNLKNLSIIHVPGVDADADEFRRIKEEAEKFYQENKNKTNLSQKTSAATAPTLGNNWNGNPYSNSIPNDNHIAVSNNGIVISVVNTTIRAYQDANDLANPAIWSRSLQSFIGTTLPGNSDIKFDPRVIYDPKADRFIIVYLVGSTDVTNKIPVAFSKTNDPRDGWNIYILTGNPNNDGTWTDYPQIGMTDEEFFITGNSFSNAGQSRYSVIWQINKANGYNGDANLTYRTFQMAQGHFSAAPVIYGSTTQGPKMYFLTTISRPGVPTGSIRLHMIDNTITNGGQLVTLSLTSPLAYRVPPSADQPGSTARNLNTNECRVQGAFFENNKIQFVFNSGSNTGQPSIYHGVIHDVNGAPAITAQIISHPTLSLGFPSISYAGNGPDDHSSIIATLHTSSTDNPGTSALFMDSNFTPSDFITVKSGTGLMSTGIDGNVNTERWGDYMGIARFYPQHNVAFIGGSYGTPNNDPGTWVGKVHGPNGWGVSTDKTSENVHAIKMYPNPVSELVMIEFNLPVNRAGYYTANLYDSQGRLVKELVRNRLREGTARISFNTAHLSPGNYIVKVEDEQGSLWQDKLVIIK